MKITLYSWSKSKDLNWFSPCIVRRETNHLFKHKLLLTKITCHFFAQSLNGITLTSSSMIVGCELVGDDDTDREDFKYHSLIGNLSKCIIIRQVIQIHIEPSIKQAPTSIEYACDLGNQFAI